ncbi:hypothetical protein [Eubacterium pyruvativorans]|uniref:hypothetical protein n=1 Tax=Eubacterium pyruvativorans TaxID=155865 RepID=UPI0023F20CF7|nr:hypothetical protein [Eubacterium pyruvativorans]MDD7684345.1 hypothetical protein [Eubacterium pyruvativorans]
MKNLITAVPCIVILLAILMEFVQMEAVYSKVIRAEAAIENFRQEVRAEGCVTGERETALRRELVKITGCREKEVEIGGTRERTERPGRIRFRVLFPVKPALGAAGFWGIPSARNRFRYRADRSCISEYLPEKKEERKEKEGKNREESHHDHSYSAVRNHASDDGESDGGSPPAPSENGRRDR